MSVSTIEKYLDKISKSAIENHDFDLLETNNIAQKLKLSRSTVSRYLNEGYKKGEFSKIQTHPIKFISIRILKKYFKEPFLNYDTVQKMMDSERIHSTDSGDIFNAVIGSGGSLVNQIGRAHV